ncbi:general substrate transporter [Athelia psychrophila]|uniref:General substrate transporter n=1 Tax=Athelia psychrophila TaxID=1759441 RepID=A0A166MBF8_9AGAM|nr:general substrate transporter [Fibularhizoctonia sp. CBS 109695]
MPEGNILGLMNSAQNIGGLAALPLSPFISDRFGRRKTILTGSCFLLCGVVLQGLALSVDMFIGSRVIIGFGVTLLTNAAPLLIAELAYPTQRGKITSMYNTLWYSGSIISAWACYAAFNWGGATQWTWRGPTLLQAIGPILQICLIWFIPESPRFLASRGLESEASKVLARYHSNSGSEQDSIVLFEMAQIRHALKLEKETSKGNFWQLWTTRGNLKRLRIICAVALFSQLSGNGLVSYYISLVLDGVGIESINTKTAINGGLQVWNLAFAMTGALLVDKVGRRPLFLISTIGMLATFSMWTLTTALFSARNNDAAAKATVPIMFIYFAFYDICYTPLLISYTLEILPYGIRAKGFAIMFALVFDQFVNPVVLDMIGWKYYLAYCVWLIAEVAFVFKYIVETKGRTLEETAALFDGEKPQLDLARVTSEATVISITPPVTAYPLTERSKTADPSTEDRLRDVSLQKLNFDHCDSLRRQSQESSV